LIQDIVQADSIIAFSQRSKEFCNTIGSRRTFLILPEVHYQSGVACRKMTTQTATAADRQATARPKCDCPSPLVHRVRQYKPWRSQ